MITIAIAFVLGVAFGFAGVLLLELPERREVKRDRARLARALELEDGGPR